MVPILQGSLRHFPLQQLLPLLGDHKHNGTLEIEAKTKRFRLFFRDGVVIGAQSASGNDATAIVASLLFEENAVFNFVDSVELPAGAPETKLAVGRLLEEAERQAAGSPTFPDDARFYVLESPHREISIKPEQFKLLFRIGSGRSFEELMGDGGMSRQDLAAMLRALERSGLIACEEAKEGEEEVQTPPPKPAKRVGALTANAPQTMHVHPLIEDTYIIGRAPGNDIVIADASVSSKHARITRTEAGFTIEDLGSRNGTFVNGDAVKEAVALADNDTVRLGKLIFTFNLAEEHSRRRTTQSKLVGS